MCWRMRMSSKRYFENSFSVYQLDFHSWMMPTLRPPGCTFWPTSRLLLVWLRRRLVLSGGVSEMLFARLFGGCFGFGRGLVLGSVGRRLGLGGRFRLLGARAAPLRRL